MTPPKISTLATRTVAAAVLGLCGFLLLFQLGEVPFYGDETLYVRIAARAMTTGQWAPLLGGNTAFVWKPPIVVWGNGAGMCLLGQNELGARAAVVIAGLLLCALLAWYGRRIGGPWTMAIAPLALVSAPGLLLDHGLRSAVPEAWLLLAVTASFFWYLEAADRGLRLQCAGLALLSLFSSWTKGIVGLLVVGGALFLVELILPGEARGSASHLRARIGRATAVAVAATVPGTLFYLAWLWFSLGTPGAVLHFLQVDLVSRAGPGLDPIHLQSPWVYLQAYWDNFGPFALAAPATLILFLIGKDRTDTSAEPAARRLHLTLLLWIVTVFVLFAIPKSRLAWYVFPAYPGLALATALTLDAVRQKLARWHSGLAIFLCLLALLAVSRARTLVALWPAKEPHSLAALQHRLDENPAARAFVEQPLVRGETADQRVAQWHRHYLRRFAALPERKLPAEAPDCSYLVTAEPEAWRPILGDRLAGTSPVTGGHQSHLPLVVLDLCGGEFSRGAP